MADMNCPICLEVFGSTGLPVMVSSGQFYCIRCVYGFIYKTKSFTDPYTRQDLDNKYYLVPRVINQVREYREATGLDNALMKVSRYGKYNVWTTIEKAVFEDAIILKDYGFIVRMLPSKPITERNYRHIWERILLLGLYQVIEHVSFKFSNLTIAQDIMYAIENNHWRTINVILSKSGDFPAVFGIKVLMDNCVTHKRMKCLIQFVKYATIPDLLDTLVFLRSVKCSGSYECRLKIVITLLERVTRYPNDDVLSSLVRDIECAVFDCMKDFSQKGLISYMAEIINHGWFTEEKKFLLGDCLSNAVFFGRVEMSRFLIKHGACVNGDHSPLVKCIAETLYAKKGRNLRPRIYTKLITMLMDHGAEDDRVMRKVAESECMKLLIFIESQKIRHPEANLGTYEDAMIVALKYGTSSMVRYLGKKMNLRNGCPAVDEYLAGEDVISSIMEFHPNTWKAYCTYCNVKQ